MYLGIDLGSTNIKAALYDENMFLVDRRSVRVEYLRAEGKVEFDAKVYCTLLLQLLKELLEAHGVKSVKSFALTGQAETLIVLDENGEPLMNAISWMDERSGAQCEVLSRQFDPRLCEAVTGQQAVLPTWPATKVLWLKENCPDIFAKAKTYMLLKDYVVYYLTGVMLADMSIATFSFWFDIYKKTYWQEMLCAIGITQEQLPRLCEPCTDAGTLLPEHTQSLGLSAAPMVNVGTLDHFAGMIGTGNITPGGITLSTGTVMALSAMCRNAKPCGIAMHYGFFKNTYVMLPVAESGGVSLEWFRKNCLHMDYEELNARLAQRSENTLLFLPYLVGTNAPEFDAGATGVFWGLRQEHDSVDMAAAVMEGVAFVLRKNCEHMAANGLKPSAIIATGGGAKSAYWCQLQADITGLPVHIPVEKEAACLGAAMIAAVSSGYFENYSQAAKKCVAFSHTYQPAPTKQQEKKYRQFCALYEASLSIGRIE